MKCDILIVGGGMGGCAAALSAASLGHHVIMTEATDWIGGQLTSQMVPPDEHPWIEQFGCTLRYRQLREGIRRYYKEHYPLTAAARLDPFLNPGGGNVSPISHEPRVSLAVLYQMMSYFRSCGRLEIRLRREPIAADTEGDIIRSITFQDIETGNQETISAKYILDATELGDLLPLAKAEYVTGAESQDETGEPHAVSGTAQPDNVQGVTWCFPMAYDPHGEHGVDKPDQYDRWREYTPQLDRPWTGKMLDWTIPLAQRDLTPWTQTLFLQEGDNVWKSLWLYRRIVTREHYPEGAMPHEATVVNWTQNDYFEGSIIDKPEAEVKRHLEAARQLSLSLLYWLQTEAVRPDGGHGYPGLYLRPDIAGTADGLAKSPYIRESRRIRAQFTVTENHVGVQACGSKFPELFSDSVGIGHYSIDIHPTTGRNAPVHIPALPFQIPLGALLPVRMRNLLPACKNLGVTHVTNGCYRLHPVEWNIGESAGLLAAFCLQRHVPPCAVRENSGLLDDFQKLLRAQGVELEWPWSSMA